MNARESFHDHSDIESRMQATLAAQKADFLSGAPVSADQRRDRLNRGIDVLLRYQDRLVEALHSDFGCRSREATLLTDIAAAITPMKYAARNLRRWMKGERRPTLFPLNLLGGRSRIEYQPLGVVGVISPWNFPVNLTFGPLAGILAAGNRAMIKPSEFTPATAEVMAEMVKDAWEENEVAIFAGGPEVGVSFSGLAFDHLLFTGATSVARHIMAAAARNLVPVTLELGGQSPVIISRSADLGQALGRIMLGKTLNAGQICLAPDYLLVPEEKLHDVIEAAQATVATMYPTLLGNPQYTSVINERHLERLQGYLQEAEERGIKTLALNPGNEDFSQQQGTRKLPPTLVLEPADDLKLMQEEIFGPLLPIRTYREFEETIAYVNANPRPLAAYYFGEDRAEEEAVLTRTTSGGVCINDVLMHVMQEELPFGGVGASGMGAYHGHEGFKTFSHVKSIYRQTNANVARMGGLLPPYNRTTERSIRTQLRK
ncbi:MAG: coniferyl aldehyde dehydrogenase [Parahaliea sp.]